MNACRIGNIIYIASDIADALSGMFKGYQVQLHAAPKVRFHVQAATADKAIKLAHALYQRETGKSIGDAATFQAFDGERKQTFEMAVAS